MYSIATREKDLKQHRKVTERLKYGGHAANRRKLTQQKKLQELLLQTLSRNRFRLSEEKRWTISESLQQVNERERERGERLGGYN